MAGVPPQIPMVGTNMLPMEISYRICGGETLVPQVGILTGETMPSINATFLQYSTNPAKGGSVQMIPYDSYKDIYMSNFDTYCPITERELVWRPNGTSFDEPAPGRYVMKDRDNNILISTSDLIDAKNHTDLH